MVVVGKNKVRFLAGRRGGSIGCVSGLPIGGTVTELSTNLAVAE